jgi:hypothetical protein
VVKSNFNYTIIDAYFDKLNVDDYKHLYQLFDGSQLGLAFLDLAILEAFIKNNNIKSITELGCGPHRYYLII